MNPSLATTRSAGCKHRAARPWCTHTRSLSQAKGAAAVFAGGGLRTPISGTGIAMDDAPPPPPQLSVAVAPAPTPHDTAASTATAAAAAARGPRRASFVDQAAGATTVIRRYKPLQADAAAGGSSSTAATAAAARYTATDDNHGGHTRNASGAGTSASAVATSALRSPATHATGSSTRAARRDRRRFGARAKREAAARSRAQARGKAFRSGHIMRADAIDGLSYRRRTHIVDDDFDAPLAAGDLRHSHSPLRSSQRSGPGGHSTDAETGDSGDRRSEVDGPEGDSRQSERARAKARAMSRLGEGPSGDGGALKVSRAAFAAIAASQRRALRAEAEARGARDVGSIVRLHTRDGDSDAARADVATEALEEASWRASDPLVQLMSLSGIVSDGGGVAGAAEVARTGAVAAGHGAAVAGHTATAALGGGASLTMPSVGTDASGHSGRSGMDSASGGYSGSAASGGASGYDAGASAFTLAMASGEVPAAPMSESVSSDAAAARFPHADPDSTAGPGGRAVEPAWAGAGVSATLASLSQLGAGATLTSIGDGGVEVPIGPLPQRVVAPAEARVRVQRLQVRALRAERRAAVAVHAHTVELARRHEASRTASRTQAQYRRRAGGGGAAAAAASGAHTIGGDAAADSEADDGVPPLPFAPLDAALVPMEAAVALHEAGVCWVDAVDVCALAWPGPRPKTGRSRSGAASTSRKNEWRRGTATGVRGGDSLGGDGDSFVDGGSDDDEVQANRDDSDGTAAAGDDDNESDADGHRDGGSGSSFSDAGSESHAGATAGSDSDSEAAEAQERKHDGDDPDAVAPLQGLAASLIRQGLTSLAMRHLSAALTLCKRWFGPYAPETAEAWMQVRRAVKLVAGEREHLGKAAAREAMPHGPRYPPGVIHARPGDSEVMPAEASTGVHGGAAAMAGLGSGRHGGDGAGAAPADDAAAALTRAAAVPSVVDQGFQQAAAELRAKGATADQLSRSVLERIQ